MNEHSLEDMRYEEYDRQCCRRPYQCLPTNLLSKRIHWLIMLDILERSDYATVEIKGSHINVVAQHIEQLHLDCHHHERLVFANHTVCISLKLGRHNVTFPLQWYKRRAILGNWAVIPLPSPPPPLPLPFPFFCTRPLPFLLLTFFFSLPFYFLFFCIILPLTLSCSLDRPPPYKRVR